MRNPPLILLVDDDPHIRDVVRFALHKAGMSTVEASTGLDALQQVQQHLPDLVVLDILMPEMDGLEVCRRLRATHTAPIPIVFLSSRDEELDRILGLEMGGDDYVTKPFSPRELVARIRAVLRRFTTNIESSSPGSGSPEHPITSPQIAPISSGAGRAGESSTRSPSGTERGAIGSDGSNQSSSGLPGSSRRAQRLQHHRLVLDLDRCVAFWEGREVVLTATELGILRTLMRFPGKVFNRDELMDGIYEGEVVVSDRTIDSHIRRVRRKFEPLGGDPIQTLHGMGYRLSEC